MPDYDEEACRRLIAVLLLKAIWAAHGDEAERAWLTGPSACQWAGLLGLSRWPPGPEALAQLDALNVDGRGRRRLRAIEKDEW